MFTLLFAALGFCRIVEEDFEGETVRTPLYRRDPLFYLFIVLPIAIGVPTAFLWQVTQWWVPSLGVFSALIGGINILGVKRVTADSMAGRQFLGGIACFTNCLVWAPETFSLTKLVRFPGSLEVFFTTGPDEEIPDPGLNIVPRKIIVQLGQGQPHAPLAPLPENPDETLPPIPLRLVDLGGPEAEAVVSPIPTGMTDEQLVIVQVTYRLDIHGRPWSLIQSFFREFICQKGEKPADAMKRALRNKVEPDIADVLSADAVEILQLFYTEETIGIALIVNRYLRNHLESELDNMGVKLISTNIKRPTDVRPGGYIAQRSKANRAEQAANARTRKAVADQTAGVALQESEKAIALAEQALLDVEIGNEDREAQKAVLLLKHQVGVLPDGTTQRAALVSRVVNMDDDIIVDVAGSIADGLPNLNEVTIASLSGLGDLVSSITGNTPRV